MENNDLSLERLYGEVKYIKTLIEKVQYVVLNGITEENGVRLGYNLSKLEDCIGVLNSKLENEYQELPKNK